MKNLFLTIAIVLYSVSITAQMKFRAYSLSYKKGIESVPENRITSYSTKVISNENFKYRAFLRESRQSNEKFQIGQQHMSEKELTKLLRNCARKSNNPEEFKEYLMDSNPEFSNYFSDKQTQALYSKFKKGTLKQYVTDLINDW